MLMNNRLVVNNRSIKKLFVFLLVFCTVASWIAPSLTAEAVNLPYTIHESREAQYIASGVLYENIRRFTSQGWWNINVIRVDLTNEYAEIKGLMSEKGISNRDTVSNMVSKSKAVAGINGDFFDFSPISSPIGAFISEGKIISSPVAKEYAWPSFLIDYNNKAEITLLDRKMAATSLTSKGTVTIHNINKFKPAGDVGVILYNKHWGDKTPGGKYFDDWVEVVVDNNIVTDIRIGQEPVKLKENRYVLAARDFYRDGLLKHFKVGHEVKLSITLVPDLENIKLAIGGGSIILKDGVPTATHNNVRGNHPRTGIGISKDGNELILATIDGRDVSFKGVEQNVFGAIFKELGAYNAINLDGGGSTTMAVKPIGEEVAKVVNKPSDGGERRVINGVGVFSNAPVEELSYIKVETDDKNMFLNTTRKFTIKGYDRHHNPVEIDESKAIYTFEGVEGEISENKFKAKSSGKVTVQAYYEGLTATIDLKVLDEVETILLPIDKFNIDVNSKKSLGTIYGMDKNGFKAKIYPEDIDWTVIGDIGYVENGVFYSGEKIGSGAITARIGKGINNILVSVGSGNGVFIEGFENIENFKSTTYPEFVKASISLNEEAKEGKASIGLKYDFTEGEVSRASYLLFAKDGKDGLALEGNPSKLAFWVKGDGNGPWLRGTIRDKNGNRHTIDFARSLTTTQWQLVEANIPSDIAYPITLERIYVVEIDANKKYAGEILIDNLMAHYPVSYENIEVPEPSSFRDSKNTKVDKAEDGFSLIVTRTPANLKEIGGQASVNKILDRINKHELGVFVGGINGEVSKAVKLDQIINIKTPFKTNRYKNVMLIDASSAKGGLRPTNPQQWLWLQDRLNNAAEDHIFLFLNTPIWGQGGFTDPLEAELLHKTLVNTFERGKSIWVIYNGSTNKVDVKDGVRYIEFNNRSIETEEDLKGIRTIEFVVNGKNISYQINSAY